jgi:hypothetical protein
MCVIHQEEAVRQLRKILGCRRNGKLRAVDQTIKPKVFAVGLKKLNGWPESELRKLRLKLLELDFTQATFDNHRQQVAKLLNKAIQLEALSA